MLNGFSDNLNTLSEELRGFAEVSGIGLEIQETIVICSRDAELNKVMSLVPTERVTLITAGYYQPELFLEAMERNVDDRAIYLFGSDFASRELAVRLAVRKGGSSIIGALSLNVKDEKPIVNKRIYSNHMEGVFSMNRAPYFVSLAKGGNTAGVECAPEHTIRTIDIPDSVSANKDLRTLKKPQRIDDLEGAKILIAAGRGVGGRDGLKSAEELAKAMGAVIGVSKPVAMSGWAPLDRMIGISGAMTKPSICVTVGVSGAAAFFAGVEKSGIIISINNDPDSPIMKNSDVIIIDDYKAIISELIKFLG